MVRKLRRLPVALALIALSFTAATAIQARQNRESLDDTIRRIETGRGAVVPTNSDTGGALAQELIRPIAQEYGWRAVKLEKIGGQL